MTNRACLVPFGYIARLGSDPDAIGIKTGTPPQQPVNKPQDAIRLKRALLGLSDSGSLAGP